ncbi:tRNA (guanine-N(7)-)-methyltransferase OS=Streptomyces albaduncus OX=68172 GN=trmB PE=3 SV=1 [Streptomyces griseoloalbus]
MANGDAIILLREMLAPDALSGLRVLLARSVAEEAAPQAAAQPEFLTLAASRLAPGAVLHCATDWEPYAEQMLEVLTAHPDFENTREDGGFAPRPGFLTRFERQGLDRVMW